MTNNQPIVDTDIWVFLVLSGFYKRLIKYYGRLNFSDTVEQEIMKWQGNIGNSRQVAAAFKEMKAADKVAVIHFEDFTYREQLAIQHQLSEYGLKHVKTAEKNKGEFVTYLYALNKGIKRMKTNDRGFAATVGPQSQLTLVNWEDILDNYSNSPKEKTEARKVVMHKEEKMKKESPAQQDPRWEKLRGLL